MPILNFDKVELTTNSYADLIEIGNVINSVANCFYYAPTYPGAFGDATASVDGIGFIKVKPDDQVKEALFAFITTAVKKTTGGYKAADFKRIAGDVARALYDLTHDYEGDAYLFWDVDSGCVLNPSADDCGRLVRLRAPNIRIRDDHIAVFTRRN